MSSNDEQDAIVRAMEALQVLLSHGPKMAHIADRLVRQAAQCSKATVRRARWRLNVRCEHVRQTDGPMGCWIWRLPDDRAELDGFVVVSTEAESESGNVN